MTRRPRPSGLPPEVAAAVRSGFELLYDRPLADAEVGEVADNLRRFHAVLSAWSRLPPSNDAPNTPPRTCDATTPDNHPAVPFATA